MPLAAELPFAFYAIAALVFGLMVGSFLNVVIWRVPRGESIAFPGSHCGSCGTALKPYDNIPLLSYAVLDGKCRHCKAKISWFYPAVELLTGLLFLAVVWKSGPTWVAIAEMIFVAVIVSLTFIDARHQLLPNVITYPAFLFSLCAAGLIASFPVEPGTLEAYLEPEAFPDNNLGKLIVVPLLLACALPIFWLIDRMDDVLFGKYFEPSETETFEPSAEELEIETRINARHQRVIQATMINIF